jgi:hypothetical protein
MIRFAMMVRTSLSAVIYMFLFLIAAILGFPSIHRRG